MTWSQEWCVAKAVLLVITLLPVTGCTIPLRKEAVVFVPAGSNGPDGERDIYDRFIMVFAADRDIKELARWEGSMLGVDMRVACLNGSTEVFSGYVDEVPANNGNETGEQGRWRYLGCLSCFDDLSTERLLREDYDKVVFQVRIRYMVAGRYSFTPFCLTRAELVSVIRQGYKSRPGGR